MEYPTYPNLPSKVEELIPIATQQAERILTERPALVRSTTTEIGTTSLVDVACYFDDTRRVLDTGRQLAKLEPIDGSPATYLFRVDPADRPSLVSYAWQVGAPLMAGTVEIGNISAHSASLPADFTAYLVNLMRNGQPFDKHNEVNAITLFSSRPRLVPRSRLYKIGKAVGWYF